MLDGLSKEQKLDIVSRFGETYHFSKNELIYDSIHFEKAIGYIVSGKVTASDGGAGAVVMKCFSEGQCFGAAAVFGAGDTYVSSIEANTETEILFISEIELRKIFEQYPLTAVNYITFLSEKIRFLNNRLSVIAGASAEDSLYRYLSMVADADGYAAVPQNMTLLAKLTGLSRASLYRSLSSLEAEGLIMRENNTWRVNKK